VGSPRFDGFARQAIAACTDGAYLRAMPDLELKPTEVRKSERLPPVLVAWGLVCCGFMVWMGLVAAGYDWKPVALCTFAGTFLGYLIGTRFRITLK
jgi:hypothetical protein